MVNDTAHGAQKQHWVTTICCFVFYIGCSNINNYNIKSCCFDIRCAKKDQHLIETICFNVTFIWIKC